MVLMEALADPSLDVRDRVAAASGIREFPDKIWFHKLAAAVIDADRCVRCGTCIAACPSNSIGVATDGLPTLNRMCTGCSSCWDFCPLGGLRTTRLQQLSLVPNGRASYLAPVADSAARSRMGRLRAAYEARARERVPGAQDGGVVTALLVTLLEAGFIQGALLSHKQSALKGESVLATTPEAIRQGAGSVFDQTYPLAELPRGLPAGVDEIALVGTPCQIAGLRALQRFPWRYRTAPVERVKLAVALFCTRSFDAQRLTLELLRRGVDLGRVAKLDVRDGWLRAHAADGAVLFETRARALSAAALPGCDECADFTGVLADIAVGNLGSRRGYTTVLVRTDRGAEAWERAAAALEAVPLDDLAAVHAMAQRNAARAARASRRESDRDGELWVRYSEHLAAYLPTERAPVAPPPHRSHHYTVAC